MKPSGREKPSPFRKSEEESGEKSKSGMSPRLANGSPPRSDSVTESQRSEILKSSDTCSYWMPQIFPPPPNFTQQAHLCLYQHL